MTKTLEKTLILFMVSLASLGPLLYDANAERYSSIEDIVVECQGLYDQFVLLGEVEFRKIHNYDNLSQKCSLLFHDSLWDYSGKDRVSILADRLSELMIKKTSSNFEKLDPFIRDIAKMSTDTVNEYRYSFEVCGEEDYLEISSVLIQSDTKNIKLQPNYFLSPNACIEYNVLIEAINPQSIRVSSYSIEETQGIEELRVEIDSLKKELEEKMEIIQRQIKSLMDLAKIV